MTQTQSNLAGFDAVNNERTEIIKSVSIQNLVNCRQGYMSKVRQVFELLVEADQLAVNAGVSRGLRISDLEYIDRHALSGEISSEVERSRAIRAFELNLDKRLWAHLMDESNMCTLMDAKAKEQWRNSLDRNNFPEISLENIEATFKELNSNKLEMFERGVLGVFKALSWDFKTNTPVKFGLKIILSNVFNCDSFGFRMNYGYRRDQIADLERVVCILDGQPVPEFRNDINQRISDFISNSENWGKPYEDAYFKVRFFKKGTAHITFLREDLVEKLNEILTKHHPDALPSAV